ncbi:CAP domain-containing protein [Phaeosphaeriaceae sp. PMI808]|nr:CAP domain-containing protein [Phaeosphaeriaceae sp. PMI808]
MHIKILATTLLTLLLLTATATPTPCAPNPRDLIADDAPHQDDPNFISAVMRAHWYWRKLHCAQDLVWDPELASAARKDVEECTKKPSHKRPGSNLSSVTPAPRTYEAWIEFARSATHGWHEEETKYPYTNPSADGAWGHFTQMVWRNSSTIGCAVGHCNDTGEGAVEFPGRFYCYYYFFGNNVAEGQFRQQVWAPVCGDPAVGEVRARADVEFDWTVRH